MTIPTPEAIAVTLAYYNCRRVNPKADDPVMGYHTFSENQREFLSGEQAEAASEVHRMIANAAAQAKAEALREAADVLVSGQQEIPGRSAHEINTGLSDWTPWGEVNDWLRARAATIESAQA